MADARKSVAMKLLPKINKGDLTSLGFCTSLEIAAGGILTAMLLRWIAL
jgi:hypothetical protein